MTENLNHIGSSLFVVVFCSALDYLFVLIYVIRNIINMHSSKYDCVINMRKAIGLVNIMNFLYSKTVHKCSLMVK